MHTRLTGNLEGNRQFGAPRHTRGGVNTREIWAELLDQMSCLKWGAVASCCEHGDESLCPVKYAGFREQLRNYQLLEKSCASCSQLIKKLHKWFA